MSEIERSEEATERDDFSKEADTMVVELCTGPSITTSKPRGSENNNAVNEKKPIEAPKGFTFVHL